MLPARGGLTRPTVESSPTALPSPTSVAAGYSRMQLRDGVPLRMSRIDHAFLNAPGLGHRLPPHSRALAR